MEDQEARRKLGRLLRGQAEYLKIREGSKAPVGSFKQGRRNRYKRVPAEGNFGILPQGPLVILDVDVHKGGTLEEQIPLFSDLLGVPLLQTYAVNTPSGGRHFYLNLPSIAIEGAQSLPKASLRSFQTAIRELTGKRLALVDADLRSEAANGYVLGIGSSLDGHTYEPENWNPILSMSEEGYANLLKLPLMREDEKAQGRAAIDLWSEDPGELPPPVQGPSPGLGSVPARSVEKLERALANRAHLPYHQRRAFVKAALHCCYSNAAIADTCIVLAINKDSATDRSISKSSLLKDIATFDPKARFHGPYCPVGQAPSEAKRKRDSARPVFTLEQSLEHRRARVDRMRRLPDRVAFRSSNPRVLDIHSISQALARVSKRKEKAAQYRNALLIVEGVLQPLANVGAEKFLLSQAFLQRTLDLTPSQASAALRLLRLSGVVEVRDKQAQGFAPTYVVHPAYVHRKLTFHLKRTWVAREAEGAKDPLVFSAREGGFKSALTGEDAFTNSLAERLASAQAAILQAAGDEPCLSALAAYLGTSLPIETS